MKNFNDPRKILIIKLGALGDVMMAEGIMRCIREHYPNAKISLITEPLYARFMKKSPHLDDVISHKRLPRWRFFSHLALKSQLESGNFDLVIDLQNSSHSVRFQSWLQDAFISSTSKYADLRYSRDRSRGLASREYLREQVESIGIDVSDGYFSNLEWASENVCHVLTQKHIENGFALLFVGSSARHPKKRWHGFPELIEELAVRNIEAVTAPGPDEIEMCQELDATVLMDGDKFLTLNQLIGLAKYCSFVVGNDTGPTHMMAAANTKGVALFGSNHSPAANTGIAGLYEIIEKPVLNDISVAEVLKAIERL